MKIEGCVFRECVCGKNGGGVSLYLPWDGNGASFHLSCITFNCCCASGCRGRIYMYIEGMEDIFMFSLSSITLVSCYALTGRNIYVLIDRIGSI